MLASPWADVNNPVAFANGLFVVFDNNHRVAQITQPSQRVDEPAVITLVQTDRRLVKHVQGAHQTRTNLTCKPNALRLSSRQRSCRSSQREVIEADIEQKTESSIDLFCHAFGNHAISVRQFEARKKFRRISDRHLADLRNIPIVNRHRKCERLQSGTVTGRTRHLTHVPLKLLTSPVTICRFMAPFNPGNDSLEL